MTIGKRLKAIEDKLDQLIANTSKPAPPGVYNYAVGFEEPLRPEDPERRKAMEPYIAKQEGRKNSSGGRYQANSRGDRIHEGGLQ